MDEPNEKDEKDEKNEKKKKHKKVWLIVLLSLLSFVVVCGIAAVIVFEHYLGKIHFLNDPIDPYSTDSLVLYTPDPNEAAPSLEPGQTFTPQDQQDDIDNEIERNKEIESFVMNNDVYNVVIIGTDSRDIPYDPGNTDVMMMISVNHKSKKIWLTSFSRDSYVYIPGIGNNRINAAYRYGGAPLLLRTIQVNFKVGLDKYALINFDNFPLIIDTLGGVEITLTDEECRYVPGIDVGGTYKLNGKQALAYSRIRAIGTDFGRTQRQRTVVTELIRMLKQKNVLELLQLMDTLLPAVKTNVPKADMRRMILNLASYRDYPVEQLRIPIDGSWSYDILPTIMHILSIDSFQMNIDAIYENVFAGVDISY